jgi:hypothetical protein
MDVSMTLSAAQALSKVDGDDFVTNLSNQLLKRACSAHQKYYEDLAHLDEAIEERRDECIQRICELQHRAMLNSCDHHLIKKIIPMLLAHIGTTYEARSRKELDKVLVSLTRIEVALTRDENERRRRNKARLIAIFVSLLSLGALGLFLFRAHSRGINSSSIIPILELPLPVLLWSIIGSFAAILYRFTKSGGGEMDDPVRWLFARPLTGVVMGSITYLVVRVGLTTIMPGQTAETLGSKELMWMIAFLTGFSDRFCDTLLKALVGRFGGDKDGELVSIQAASQLADGDSYATRLFDKLKTRKRARRKDKPVPLKTVARKGRGRQKASSRYPTIKRLPSNRQARTRARV